VRPRPSASALALSALAAGALAGCGYGFTQRYVAVGGADRIHVRTIENRSTEPDLGATVTAALRGELARRGADGGEGAPAVIEGEVTATEPALASTSGAPGSAGVTSGTTWRIAVELRARLTASAGAPAVERTVRRQAHYLGGGDPLETEGRRALALRRAADEAARELLRSLER
jgi:hypothetical protein